MEWPLPVTTSLQASSKYRARFLSTRSKNKHVWLNCVLLVLFGLSTSYLLVGGNCSKIGTCDKFRSVTLHARLEFQRNPFKLSKLQKLVQTQRQKTISVKFSKASGKLQDKLVNMITSPVV